jgi:hypothetical protein
MADLRPDEVAKHVVPEILGTQPMDAVTFCGFLGAGAGQGSFYLWDTWFRTRIEFTSDQILYQKPGSERPDGRSILWVHGDANIAVCQFAPAADFAGDLAGAAREGTPVPAGPRGPPTSAAARAARECTSAGA